MELIFLGRGSAFNTIENNNSAYFIATDNNGNKELFLIDCGRENYNLIIKIIEKVKNEIKSINFLITHTHSDHIGSLSDLLLKIFYVYNLYEKNTIKCNIVIPKNINEISLNTTLDEIINIDLVLDIKTSILLYLKSNGCISNKMYNFITDEELSYKYSNSTSFNKLKYHKTKHAKRLDCYGISFISNNKIIYYSGDTCEINDYLKELLNNKDNIDKIYLETSIYNTDVHLYFNDLINLIPIELRSKVYLMHLDDVSFDYKGFNIVNTKEKNN